MKVAGNTTVVWVHSRSAAEGVSRSGGILKMSEVNVECARVELTDPKTEAIIVCLSNPGRKSVVVICAAHRLNSAARMKVEECILGSWTV